LNATEQGGQQHTLTATQCFICTVTDKKNGKPSKAKPQRILSESSEKTIYERLLKMNKDERILNLIRANHGLTAAEIAAILDTNNREVRKVISRLRRQHSIINLQDGIGYFIADLDTENGQWLNDLWIKQETNRAKANFMHLKGAINARKNPAQIDWNEIMREVLTGTS